MGDAEQPVTKQALMDALLGLGNRLNQLERHFPEDGQSNQPREEPEPEPPDHAWRYTRSNSHQTPTLSQIIVPSYHDYQPANESQLYTFSGKRNYLRWERNTDEWFYHNNNILREERLAVAIGQLTGDAYKWWLQEEDDRWFYKEPTITTWRGLKKLMRVKYAPDVPHSKIEELYPRNYLIPKDVSRAPQANAKGQGKHYVSQYMPELTCNRSKNRDYTAKESLRKKGTPAVDSICKKSVVQRSNKEGVSKELKQKPSLTRSLEPQVRRTPGLGETKGRDVQEHKSTCVMDQLEPATTFIVPPELQERWQSFKKEYSIKDKKIEQTAAPPQVKCSNSNKFKDLTCYGCHNRGHTAETCSLKKVKILEEEIELSTSDGLIKSDLLNSNSSIMHLSLSKGIDTGIEEMDKEERLQAIAIPIDQRPEQDNMKIKEDSDHTHCCDLQVNKKQEIVLSSKIEKVQVQLPQSVYNDPMTCIMHLPFPKSVEIGAGHKVDELRMLMTFPCQEPLSDTILRSESSQGGGNDEDMNLEPPDQELQAKSSIPLSLSTISCYKCHGVGHIAKLCLEHDTSLVLNNNSFKDSDNSVDTNLTTSNASILHLSLSKNAEIGLGKTSKEMGQREDQEEKVHTLAITEQTKEQEIGVAPISTITAQSKTDQSIKRKESIKEKPPDQVKYTEGDKQVSLSLTPFVSHDATAVLKSLLNIQNHDETNCLKPQVEENNAIINFRKLNSVSISYPKEPMMHLFLAQSVHLNTGTKGAKHREIAPKRNLLQGQVHNKKTSPPMVNKIEAIKEDDVPTTYQFEENNITIISSTPYQDRGVILSYLLKGEPPDMSHLTKLQAYQGKALNSQRRMKANLLSLDADYIVSRSKPFQVREYDEDIKSSPINGHAKDTTKLTKPFGEKQPERAKDICVFLGAYLPNQEELSYESNCSRNLTHQGIIGKKNWFKILPHEEDIQFTIWMISSAPDLEVKMDFALLSIKKARPKLTKIWILFKKRPPNIWEGPRKVQEEPIKKLPLISCNIALTMFKVNHQVKRTTKTSGGRRLK